MCAAPCKNMPLGICRQQRPRSACMSLQSDQGLPCLLTESLDATECMNGQQNVTGDNIMSGVILQ